MLILDTHVLVWYRLGDARLGERARREIDRAFRTGQAAVSAFTFWELAMLTARGRLQLPEDAELWRRTLLAQGLNELPGDGAIGIRANRLLGFHPDPADRIIAATALDGHTLLTADRPILDWPGALSRLDAAE